jgi:TetR/AcrR family transcriptional repressor of nem operon
MSPPDTRSTILAIAERLLMQRGYHAFSYKHIAEELGIKTAAVHYHFRTKEQLVVAVVQAYGARFDRWVSATRQAPADARLLGYFEIGRQVVAHQRVCALAMIGTQFDAVPEAVQLAVHKVQQRFIEFYATALTEGRSQGVLRFEGTADDKAIEASCALVGAQQLARVIGPGAYDAAIRQLEISLGVTAHARRHVAPSAKALESWLAA